MMRFLYTVCLWGLFVVLVPRTTIAALSMQSRCHTLAAALVVAYGVGRKLEQ